MYPPRVHPKIPLAAPTWGQVKQAARRLRAPLFGTLLLFALAGCATQAPSKPHASPATADPPLPLKRDAAANAEEHYWWYVRFRHPWPQGAEPAWHRDVLLAHRIIAPLVTEHGEAIPFWRIHRRAARGPAGHQFSFIFRSTPDEASRINARIASDPLLASLLREQELEAVLYDDPEQAQRPELADASDTSWEPEMQHAWPHFILGVSKLWLALIEQLAAAQIATEDTHDDVHQHTPATLAALQERYASINDELDALWLHQGGHALLHHLSAVFGYREVTVTRRERMRF